MCSGSTKPITSHFRFQSALKAARATRLLIVVGTSGATNLPNQVAWTVQGNGGTIFDVNIEANPFSQLARQSSGGAFFQMPSSRFLPELIQRMESA
jgi:NAD-dependent deacetylase